jgi:hypothetical protein
MVNEIPKETWDELEKRLDKLMRKAMNENGVIITKFEYTWLNDLWATVDKDKEHIEIGVDGHIKIPKEWLAKADKEEYEAIKNTMKKAIMEFKK